MTKPERRLRILDQAAECVSKSRCEAYGDAEDNLGMIAELWNTYINNRPFLESINAMDVAAMMALFKIGRIATNQRHLDNWVDLCGYGACGGGIAIKEAESEQQSKLQDDQRAKTDRSDIQEERIRVSVDGESGGCCAIREDDAEHIQKVVGSVPYSNGPRP